jgi:hypothetical protein
MLHIANENQELIQQNVEEFLEILGKGLEKCGKLPGDF